MFLIWVFLGGIALFLIALPFVAMFKTATYVAQGGLPKVVRCPSCTEKQEAPANQPDHDCKRCGTPILRGGEFASKATGT